MPRAKKTDEDVAWIVASEGLGYAVESYLGADSIESQRLREAWQRAQDALAEIRDILEPFGAEM